MTHPLRKARYRSIQRQMSLLERRRDQLDGICGRLSMARLIIVLVGVALSIVVFRFAGAWPGIGTLVLTTAIFIPVVRVHGRLAHRLRRHRIALDIHQTDQARMGLDWSGITLARTDFEGPPDPIETDLDLTGTRSIHRLLDTSISREGSERLRSWLVRPDDASQDRQDLVREFAELRILRSRLAVEGSLAWENPRQRFDGQQLIDWLEMEPKGRGVKPFLILLSAIALVTFTLFFLHSFSLIPKIWPLSFLIYLGIYFSRIRDLQGLHDEAFPLEQALTTFRTALLPAEQFGYGDHEKLKAFCEPFRAEGIRPAPHLRRIARVAGFAAVQKSGLVWLALNIAVPWDLYFRYRLNQCREDVREHLPRWLERWYELEAIGSLARFSHLNPDYVFPEISGRDTSPLFHAANLGHPLIPDAKKICNDFTLENSGDIAVITGSNMSGKSTFLKTLGVNLCLLWAGGPVNASVLRTVPLRVFTCIKVTDSVSDGISYFYAEVRRLSALLKELEGDDDRTLFVLIDEMFRGTNNRERLIGSRAYIRSLTGRNCIGAIATHDLELIKLADDSKGVWNYHFREEVMNGRMVFDYLLRTGPCPTTNALKIMRMEGLPVDPEE